MKKYINIKSAWYLAGALLLIGLSALTISCAMIEPPSPPLPVATTVPPFIPHSLEGRADCRACHAEGLGGAPQLPANHAKRPSDLCLACHEPASGSEQEKVPSYDLAASPFGRQGASTSNATPAQPAETETTAPPVETTPTAEPTPKAVSATQLFSSRCAACHGANRQGVPGLAPALNPESLAALSDTEIRDMILDGRSGTMMPAFKETLSPEEIDALLKLIKSPLP